MTWVKLIIEDPYPLFPGGPYYAAGSTWYHGPNTRPWVERQAAALRARGYTVTVVEEARP